MDTFRKGSHGSLLLGRNTGGRLAFAKAINIVFRGLASYSTSSSSSSSISPSVSPSPSHKQNDDDGKSKSINLFSAVNEALHIALESDPRFVFLYSLFSLEFSLNFDFYFP